jgi:hypothetical protein
VAEWNQESNEVKKESSSGFSTGLGRTSGSQIQTGTRTSLVLIASC